MREEQEDAPTVLIVDDNEDVRLALRSLLEIAHIIVVGEAEDGYEAIELARRYQPKVVVLDDRMAYLDGAEAAYEIRLVARRTTVIAFSAYHSAVRGTPKWADAIVDKQHIDEVASVIRRLPPPPRVQRTSIRGPSAG